MRQKTQAQKDAGHRWTQENKKVLGCSVYRGDAEDFRRYCEERGQTVNAVLSAFVAECIGRPLETR